MKLIFNLNIINEIFFIFIYILCLLHNNITVTGENPAPKDCEPKSCGNNLNISYPFWLEGQQPDYCGYPPLKLRCKDNRTTNSIPVLTVFSSDFYIKDIFYDNQSFLIIPAEFAGNHCPLPSGSFLIDIYPLSVSPSNAIIFFLLNCSTALDHYDRVSCAGNGTFDYFGGLYESSTELNSVSGLCQFVEVPTVSYSVNDSNDFVASLNNGFVLDWNLPVCGECKESGGSCGYDNSTDYFMCICSDRVHKASCKKDKKNLEIVIGAVTAVGFFLVLAILFLLYMKKKRGRNSPSSKSLIRNPLPNQSLDKEGECLNTHLFLYNELAEATNDFDSSRELGDGGFGTVYQGELRDGRMVAIKRLYENNYRRLKQFMNEVDILSTLRHPNLVDLYGCTSRHSRELLLVYEFVPNGTISDHLHGSRAKEGILTWPLRLNIAIETADALAYLHAVDPPIIHRDVKTNNILLDSNFHVKVADFGLSRLFPNNVTHVSTAPQGTPGYVDPEYHQCYQLTDKSDVYSFGVVLIELISSKPAVDITRQRNEIILANLAIAKIQNGKVDQLVDMTLGYKSDSDTREAITMVAELAFRCLQSDRGMRPPIKDVLDELRAIQNKDYTLDKKKDSDGRSRDDLQLLKNVSSFSPNSVITNWTSRTA